MNIRAAIFLLLCPGWLGAGESAGVVPEGEAYRTPEFETWQELGKQKVSVVGLERATFGEVFRICRSAQMKSPEEGGIVFADVPPELAGRMIVFEWSKLRVTETSLSGVILRAAENGEATLVQEDRKVSLKPLDYAAKKSKRPLAQIEIETKGILQQRIIPRVDFEHTTLSQGMDFLRMREAEIDSVQPRKRPSFVISGDQLGRRTIPELHLWNVTLWNLLHVLAEKTKSEVDIVDDIVVFHPRGSEIPDFSAKEGTSEAQIKQWLDKRILPRVDFKDVALVDALDFMLMRDAELFSEAVPQPEQIDLLIAPELRERRIDDLRISNVSEWRLIKLLAMKSGLQLEFARNSVRFVEAMTPPSEPDRQFPLDAVETKISLLMANLRWIVAAVVPCVVGFSFWLTRRIARS